MGETAYFEAHKTLSNMLQPQHAYNVEFSETGDRGQGWCFGVPTGIVPTQWPRSRVNGLPMAHIFTCWVPAEYRTKGEGLVAVALFQADDHAADTVDGVAEADEADAGPFWASLLAYATGQHPQEIYLEDILDGGWALLWLTEAEFRGPAAAPPAAEAGIFPDYDGEDGGSAYAAHEPARFVQLVAREADPNVGKAVSRYPDEKAPDAYIPMGSEKGQALGLEEMPWSCTHFGGTFSPSYQGEPDISPFYLEFDESAGGANLATGVAQIDLLNDTLDWSR